jgi:hypothetical protein
MTEHKPAIGAITVGPEPGSREALIAAAEKAAKAMAERKARAQDRELAHLVEFNELMERFSGSHGEANVGRTWEIIDSLEGFVVVKRLALTEMDSWEQTVAKAIKSGKEVPTVNETLAHVLFGLLHPDEKTFRRWVHGDGTTPGAEAIVRLSMNHIAKLHGNYLGELRSKT